MKTVWLAVLVAGCSGSPNSGGHAGTPDFSTTEMDFATPPDFASVAIDLKSTDLSFVPACAVTGTHRQQFVADTITLPQMRVQFSMDLNGDGKLDNQLGNIVGALSSQNLDPQPGVNQALAAGTEV